MSTQHVTESPIRAEVAAPERRRKPRIKSPFPVTVLGVGSDGSVFEFCARLENLSSGGLYAKLRQPVEPGTVLFVTVSLTQGESAGGDDARVALHGVVVRSELTPEGRYGVAVAFSNHRFL